MVETSVDDGQVEHAWSSVDLDVHMFTQRYAAHEGDYTKEDELWIYLCTEGGGRLVRRSSGQDLDGLFVPGTIGVGSPEDGGEGLWPDLTLLALGIEPGRLAMLLEEMPPRSFDLEAIASTFRRNTLLAEVMREMWSEACLHGMSTAFLDHGLAIVMHQLARSQGTVSRPVGDHPLSPKEMRAVSDFVDAHIDADVSVERLARIVGLSPNHFSHRFRATTGLAPYQFVTRRRLDRAAEYLITTELSVTQVGLMTGYANPSHLAAAFKRYKGAPPLAWRRQRLA